MKLGALIEKIKGAAKATEPLAEKAANVYRFVAGPGEKRPLTYSPADRPQKEAPNEGRVLKRIAGSIGHQWVQGQYNDEMQDENAGFMHKRARELVSAATKDNPLARRMFDYLFSKKGPLNTEEQVEFVSEDNKGVKLTPDEESKAFKDPMKAESEEVPILVKIFKKLDEIKKVLGADGASGSNASKTALKQVVGIVKAQKLLAAPQQKFKPLSSENAIRFLRYRPDSRPKFRSTPGMPAKGPEISFLPHLKLKDRNVPGDVINPPIAQATQQAGGGILSGLMGFLGRGGLVGGVGKQMGGLAGKLLPGPARMAGPMAAIGAAGAAGYAAGDWMNQKMDEAEDDTLLASVREAKNKIVDSVFSLADKITGGAISGDKEIADQMFKESSVGKGFEKAKARTGEEFTKIKDAAMELWGKGKAAKENITKNVPALMEELEKQGIATTMGQKAMILGQLAHETGGFSKMEEGKYSADTVWKLRGDQLRKMGVTKDELQNVEKEKGRDAMYEYMYGDKYRTGGSKMGNVNEGDAAKFKGRGMIQLTGRANYEKASKELGIDLVSNPELITQDPEVNAKVTAWYLKNNKNVMAGLESGDVTQVSQGINGGVYGRSHGLDDRIAKTHQMATKLANLEKIPQSATGSTKIETETIAAKQSEKQPIVIAQAPAAPPSPPTPQVGASTPAAPVVPRNTDSSIRRITDGQMSYGMA